MNVLLLTEDLADQAVFKELIESLDDHHTVTVCQSVAEAWSKLTAGQIQLPSVVFVDFELSRASGHELLQIVKSSNELRTAPVIVFADSAEQEAVHYVYRLQIACFVVFPKHPDLRHSTIHKCLDFWSTCAKLPELPRWWAES